jgi:hypothetical protein
MYAGCMMKIIDPKKGRWILLVGPKPLNALMQTMIARIGEQNMLRIVDGGNRFQPYTVMRLLYDRPEVLTRVTIARAFTCHQMRDALECTPATTTPFMVLDMLGTFYDEAVPYGERKRVLNTCIAQLKRLEGQAGVIVSVHPARLPNAYTNEMLWMLKQAAQDIYHLPQPEKAPDLQMKLL